MLKLMDQEEYVAFRLSQLELVRLHFMGSDHTKLCILALKSSDATASPLVGLGTASSMKG